MFKNTPIKVPKNQILWVTYGENGVAKYAVTSDIIRSKYFLYEINGDKLIKIETAKHPIFKKMGDKK